MDDVLRGYITKRAMDLDDAERAGELDTWPTLDVDLDRSDLGVLRWLAQREGTTLESLVASIVELRARTVLLEAAGFDTRADQRLRS